MSTSTIKPPHPVDVVIHDRKDYTDDFPVFDAGVCTVNGEPVRLVSIAYSNEGAFLVVTVDVSARRVTTGPRSIKLDDRQVLVVEHWYRPDLNAEVARLDLIVSSLRTVAPAGDHA